MDKFKIISKNKINELPQTSGVYCFTDGKETIYIGKAINIRNRVKNHFQGKNWWERTILRQGFGGKVGFLITDSEIEALILEASLIKKYQPKFNIAWKDDKKYFYVAIAKNENKIPYIFITHQGSHENTKYIGPFIEGAALKKTLRFLRRAFPYYSVKKHSKNKCTYCHLDLCPGPQPNLVDYIKNVKKLILILKGKRGAVLNSLKKEMKQLSRENRFEEAGKTRDRIYNLQQVMLHTRVIEQNTIENGIEWQITQKILEEIAGSNKRISRMECYDVSNIQGKQATGSMAVFTNGKPDTDKYREFRIRAKAESNDIAMLREILQRRFSHKEWQLPEIILIDGGIAQLNVAIRVKNESNYTKGIKVFSIAKRNNDLYIEGKKQPISLKTLPRGIYNLILQLDKEAHRFAVSYHRKLREKSLLK